VRFVAGRSHGLRRRECLHSAVRGRQECLPHRIGALGWLLVVWGMGGGRALAAAAPPVLDSLYPGGGARGGAAVKVTANGKFDAWPVKVWADAPGLVFAAGEKSGELTATIGKDVAPGPHLVRVFTADGASALRCFFVGDLPLETAEIEPNDEAAKAQDLKALPATVNGRLDKGGDVDSFAVNLAAGQTLVASAQGRRLGSPIDPMLHLLGPDGTQVAFAHDGLGLDPLLIFTVEKAGRYVVRISAFAFPPAADVRLTGGKDAVYRLNLTTGPFVRSATPSGVTRGRRATLRLVGWNIKDTVAEVDATAVGRGVDHLDVPVAGGETRLRVEVGDGAESAEVKDAAVAPPVAFTGVIAAVGEEDDYSIRATKGQELQLALRAAGLKSPLSGLLRIMDGGGKVLASDDGGAAGDPRIAWNPPADGVYRFVVSDLFHNGGPDFSYRLEVRRAMPELRATLEDDVIALQPGKTATVKVRIARTGGYANPLVAVATGLPPGVTATAGEIGSKAAEGTITLTAVADAKPSSGPIRFLVLSTDPAHPDAVDATIDLKKEADKPGGQGFIERSRDAWLTLSATATTGPVKDAP